MTVLPQCVMLDLDGTLLNSLPGLEFSVREAFASEQIVPNLDPLASLVGPPIRAIFSALQPELPNATLDRLEARFRKSYDGEGWTKTTCYPDAIAVLRIVRQTGRSLFVVSNKPRHVAVKILEAEQILDLFDQVLTRDSRVPAYSSKAEMINTIAHDRRYEHCEMVMVGDTMEDAEAAAQAKVQFILMTHGYGSVSHESSVPIDRQCANFMEWLPMLAQEKVA